MDKSIESELQLTSYMMDKLELNFTEIVNMIETRRNNAYRKVNEELISLYWDFGKYISEKVKDSNWGDRIVDKLVDFMKREYPTLKGFNKRGIYRMKQFYETYKDYPNTRLLDTYSLEFLDLPNQYSEKDLKKAIISNMKEFILEIGKDFTYIGEEYRVQVGNEDFYIDLLFYNRALSCLVAFELKIGKFKPEYISKMDFYLEVLDRQEKKQNENPSVGVILCAEKDEEVVEYAMSRTMSPTMVSKYTLELIDKKLLENKLKEISNIVEENKEKID